MAGIMANSASATMASGATSADNTTSGFVADEEITLSATGTNTSYVWGIAKPSAAGSYAGLSSTTDPTPTFVPNVEGYYTVTCLLNGTTSYVLRIAVAAVGAVSALTAIRFMPIANASIPTPATGRTVYYSIESSALVEKRPDGTVHTLNVT